ncbi:MAG: hypothetical protein JST87_14615 [Bacteroidetes bacterium]|nr:hypothetical protein [Bacteroidota bacterium]
MKYILSYCLLLTIFYCTAQQKNPGEISGAWYDWTKTLKPEKPWIHDYSQTVVMKLFLCSRDSVGNVKHVYLKFSDALDEIKKIDQLTLDIPKIVYLVGWQFIGHDSGYPSWEKVNNNLKRKQDSTALQSLHWLIAEARKYHTIVSLHINMLDAFKNSPLWKTYFENNIIIKNKNGEPIPGEIFDGMQSYQISYAREWKLGYTQKRIDALLKMLPELKQNGTIHIDAFHSIQPVRANDSLSNPLLGSTISDEVETQRKIFRYWRMQGVDVTSEGDIYWLRRDPFIGLQPMSWHFNIDDFRNEKWIGKPANFDSLPPSLYCGTPMPAEQQVKEDPENLNGMLKQFCTRVVPWYYNNNTKKQKDIVWPQHDDIFLPALWLNKTIICYSNKGYENKKWKLPEHWKNVKQVTISSLSIHGKKFLKTIPVSEGYVTLSLQAGEAMVITLKK